MGAKRWKQGADKREIRDRDTPDTGERRTWWFVMELPTAAEIFFVVSTSFDKAQPPHPPPPEWCPHLHANVCCSWRRLPTLRTTSKNDNQTYRHFARQRATPTRPSRAWQGRGNKGAHILWNMMKYEMIFHPVNLRNRKASTLNLLTDMAALWATWGHSW